MEPDDRKRFGAYLRQLRTKQGLSLRDVEAAVTGVKLSNSYLYQIERGDRNPPKAETMRELARVYQVPLRYLMAAAGYEEASQLDLYENQINRAFEFVLADTSFRYGMQAQGEKLTLEAKRFIVELYQRAKPNIKILPDDDPLADSFTTEDEEEEDE